MLVHFYLICTFSLIRNQTNLVESGKRPVGKLEYICDVRAAIFVGLTLETLECCISLAEVNSLRNKSYPVWMKVRLNPASIKHKNRLTAAQQLRSTPHQLLQQNLGNIFLK